MRFADERLSVIFGKGEKGDYEKNKNCLHNRADQR